RRSLQMLTSSTIAIDAEKAETLEKIRQQVDTLYKATLRVSSTAEVSIVCSGLFPSDEIRVLPNFSKKILKNTNLRKFLISSLSRWFDGQFLTKLSNTSARSLKIRFVEKL
ncbi:unnamed protein product, partial [Nesidiocoris tenuis]